MNALDVGDSVGRAIRVFTQSQEMEHRIGEDSEDEGVASDMVHAVLNELTVVVMHAGELLSRLPPDDPQRPALEEIQRAVYSATKLLRFPPLPR